MNTQTQSVFDTTLNYDASSRLLPNDTSGWRTVTLGDISRIYDGTHQTPKYATNGIPFYSVEHVTSDDFRNTKFISPAVYDRESKRVKIEKGDILMTRIGDVGSAKYIDWDVQASFYVSLALIKCKRSIINSKFLAYLINSARFRREIWKKTLHVAFPNKINLGDIAKCRVAIPVEREQERIVAILEVWDEYLEKLDKKIKLKKNIQKGLMQKLLTGKVRLTGFTDEWRSVRLSDVCKINSDSKALPQTFLYIDLESVENGKLSKNLERIDKKTAPSRAQRILANGDVLFQMVRPYQKNNYYFNLGEGYVASSGYAQLRAKDSAKFLYHFVHAEHFVREVLKMCTGSNYPAINSSDLAKIRVLFPSPDEQVKIAGILSSVEDQMHDLELKRKFIKEQKKYLLNNLITGKIRTPEDLKIPSKETHDA